MKVPTSELLLLCWAVIALSALTEQIIALLWPLQDARLSLPQAWEAPHRGPGEELLFSYSFSFEKTKQGTVFCL